MGQRSLFGTDGVRGLANQHPMTADTALKLAMSAAHHIRDTAHTRRVIIGKDTRISGYMLEPAMAAGFVAMGFDVVMTGPIPTPGIAHLVQSMRADMGVMISASHNPYHDNGIKIFSNTGYKLSDADELAIEALLEQDISPHYVEPLKLGRAKRLEDCLGRYMEAVKATFPDGLRLEGLKIVVDCANGAAYKAAPTILWELGADVVPLGVSPNGFNINKNCGATDIDLLSETVVAEGAHLGIALDGDADRVIICDEQGRKVDGDQILGLIATAWQQRGWLQSPGVAFTVMSNLGLERYLDGLGLTIYRTQVGDRYVMEAMQQHKLNLGGEQSGHIIAGDQATTGDGLAAALQVLSVLVSESRPASEVLHVFDAMPQQLRNIKVKDRDVVEAPSVKTCIQDMALELSGKGRLLVRKSGTEPVVRIMVECEDAGLLTKVLDQVEQSLLSA